MLAYVHFFPIYKALKYFAVSYHLNTKYSYYYKRSNGDFVCSILHQMTQMTHTTKSVVLAKQWFRLQYLVQCNSYYKGCYISNGMVTLPPSLKKKWYILIISSTKRKHVFTSEESNHRCSSPRLWASKSSLNSSRLHHVTSLGQLGLAETSANIPAKHILFMVIIKYFPKSYPL